jgi:hypothetical protein
MRQFQWPAICLFPLLVSGCSDTATFVTGTHVGISANANTQQMQIGYARAELFQGPNYTDAGDAPQVVGFIASDLAVFNPHVRQLYATGEAAGLVTTPVPLVDCPTNGQPVTGGTPNRCFETPGNLTGERRPMFFGTGTGLGLKLGFTGTYPSSIKLGYDREEVSIIPLHKDNKDKADKYASVLASIDMNVTTPGIPAPTVPAPATPTSSPLGADLTLTQFFATGAAARNLAKNPYIQDFFQRAAAGAVDPKLVADAGTTLATAQKAIDAYFKGNVAQPFATVRDKLIKDPELSTIYGLIPAAAKSATSAAVFDTAIAPKPGIVARLGPVAQRLTPAGS